MTENQTDVQNDHIWAITQYGASQMFIKQDSTNWFVEVFNNRVRFSTTYAEIKEVGLYGRFLLDIERIIRIRHKLSVGMNIIDIGGKTYMITWECK